MINIPANYFKKINQKDLLNAINYIKVKLHDELIKEFLLIEYPLPLELGQNNKLFQSPISFKRDVSFDSFDNKEVHYLFSSPNRIIRYLINNLDLQVNEGLFSESKYVERDSIIDNISTLQKHFFNVDIVIDQKAINYELTLKIADKLFIIFYQIQNVINKNLNFRNVWNANYIVESWDIFSKQNLSFNRQQIEESICQIHDIVVANEFRPTKRQQIVNYQLSIEDYIWESLTRCFGHIGFSKQVGDIFEIYISPSKEKIQEQNLIYEDKKIINKKWDLKDKSILSIRINISHVLMKMLGVWHIAEIIPLDLSDKEIQIFKQNNISPLLNLIEKENK